jgi:2-polyprenyl-3-methyl-5-hydroxy-6-metoxy-1,4-benzoquinol methylase
MGSKSAFNEEFIYDDTAQERESSTVEPRFGSFLVRVLGSSHRVLDVGCGTGRYTAFARDAGNTMVGLELVQRAARTASMRGLAVLIGDSEKPFPFKPESFDCAMCVEVIEHLIEPTVTLAEINRCLKPDGMLFISTPNAAWWAHRTLLACGIPSFGHAPRYPVEVNMHIRHFTMKTLRRFLERSGFEVIATQGTFTGFPGALSEYAPGWLASILNSINSATRGFGFLAKHNILPAVTSAGLVMHARKIGSPSR